MERFSKALTSFSEEIRLPSQITPTTFNTIVKVAIDCIESATGAEAPLVTYLRREPPIPMLDREDCNRLYGKFNSNPNTTVQSPIEVRPDLIFFPVALISVLTHEGTHATDPEVRKATLFAQQFESMSRHHPDYSRKTLAWTAMENELERTALKAEVSVLAAMKPPTFLAPAQLEYFNEQQPASQAARLIQLALLDAGRVALELAQIVSGLISKDSSLALGPLLPETQAYMNYALYNRNKGDNWPDVMINAVERIRNIFSLLEEYHGSYDIPFPRFIESLRECKHVKEQNSVVANTFRLPPLRLF